VPGELTIVTGLPNSGKSEWIDALAVNLARREGWRIALCSMENSAKEHGRKLMEKYIGAWLHSTMVCRAANGTCRTFAPVACSWDV
jgi:hypothetical protein